MYCLPVVNPNHKRQGKTPRKAIPHVRWFSRKDWTVLCNYIKFEINGQ